MGCKSNGSAQDGALRLTGMPQGRARDPLKTLLRLLGTGLIGLLATGAAIWGGLALWFALPGTDSVRATVALGFVALGAGSLLTALLRRRLILPLLPFAVAFVALLAWWSTIEASNDRAWQGDVAVLPLAEINADVIALRNIRNFDYSSETDYTPGRGGGGP